MAATYTVVLFASRHTSQASATAAPILMPSSASVAKYPLERPDPIPVYVKMAEPEFIEARFRKGDCGLLATLWHMVVWRDGGRLYRPILRAVCRSAEEVCGGAALGSGRHCVVFCGVYGVLRCVWCVTVLRCMVLCGM